MDDAKKNSFPGTYPEFGAIFMSNYATKRECLRRRVFALPSSQSHFVKQVKAGMILFLFEFESKKLHGVFKASSDGEMNIFPHVFSSSGQQFPAQVKFTLMWDCDPLSENEFCDAIRENYYSKYKFNFGLSEAQVRRLLSLFNLRRMKDQAPQRQLTEREVARQSGYSTSKNRRLVDKSPMRNHVLGESGADNQHGPDISTIHQGDSFYDDDRPTDDSRFGMYKAVGYEHKASEFLNECFRDLMGNVGGDIVSGEYATSDRVDTEWKTGFGLQPAVSFGYSSGNFRSISDDVRNAKSDRIETKYYEDDGFAPTISSAYPSSFQSKLNPLMYSSKHVPETDSFIDDPVRPFSTFRTSMEIQSSNASFPMNFEDSLVTNRLPCNSDVPTMNYLGSSSLGFNQGHASLPEYTSHDSFVGHGIGTSQNQSFPSLLETRNTAITSDVHSGSRDFITLPYSNSYECSNRTSLQRPDYFDDLAAEYSKKEYCGDLSLPNPSLAPVSSSEIRNNVGISEHSSSYRTSPSNFPSLTFSDRYPTLLQDRRDHIMPERESDAQFCNDGFMFKECQPHGESFYNDNRIIEDDRFAIYNKVEYENKEDQQQLHLHEPSNVDYHGVTSSSYSLHQNSDRGKKRSSVFSRLALPPKTRKQERNISLGTAHIDRHTSVNEVMDMLHRSHNNWAKTRCKQLVKHNDDAANFRDKKQATRKEGSTMISKVMIVKSTSSRKENSSQKKGETVLVTSSRKENSSQKTGETAFVTSSRKENRSQKTGETTFVTSSRKENINQKPGETTFVDFKRRSAVRKKLEDGKTGSHCETLNDKSAPAAQCKKRKLIRPEFHENEPSDRGISGNAPELVIVPPTECYVRKLIRPEFHENKSSDRGTLGDALELVMVPPTECSMRKLIRPEFRENESSDRGISGDAPELVIVPPTECSVRKLIRPEFRENVSSDRGISGDAPELVIVPRAERSVNKNAESIRIAVVDVNEKYTSPDVKSSKAMCQTAVEGNNSDKESGSKSEQFSVESFIDSRSADQGGKESSKSHRISSMTSISRVIEQDMANSDVGIDGLSKDQNDVSRSTHESSPKICEDSDGDGAAKSEFVYSVDKMSDLTPVGDEIPISSSPKICEDNDSDGAAKSKFVYSIKKMNDLTPVGGEQDMTTSDIGIEGLPKSRNDASHYTRESSSKVCEDNDGDGAAKSEFIYSIEKMNDLTPVGGEQDLTTSDIGIEGLSKDQNDVSHSTHESSPKLCEDNDGAAKSEFVYSIEKMNDLTPVGGDITHQHSELKAI